MNSIEKIVHSEKEIPSSLAILKENNDYFVTIKEFRGKKWKIKVV